MWLIANCALIFGVGAIMLFTKDYPDGIMGKLFMSLAVLGAFVVLGETLFGTSSYYPPHEINLMLTGYGLDKVRSLRRFFLYRFRTRLDEITNAPDFSQPQNGESTMMFRPPRKP